MTKRSRKKYYIRKAFILAMLFSALFVPGFGESSVQGNTFYHIYLNGQLVGTVDEPKRAEELLIASRRQIAKDWLAKNEKNVYYADPVMRLEAEEIFLGKADSDDLIREQMENVLRLDAISVAEKSYTVKIGQYMIHLPNLSDVQEMLQAGISKYDASGAFQVDLKQDKDREFNVYTAQVQKKVNSVTEEKEILPTLGVSAYLAEMNGEGYYSVSQTGFEEFELGINTIAYAEQIEVAEGYLPASIVGTLEQGISDITKETETASIYEVKSGDTLSQIALNLNLPLDSLIEMNSERLESEKSIIHIGDQLKYSQPKATFVVKRNETIYIEETYEAPIQYIDRNDWYTNKTNVVQQPSAGFRKVVELVSYENDAIVDREICKEEVVMEAVAKIVERGTIAPPSYIKPISGGRLSSGFGKRNAPTKGASTYHKGLDWATPVGTPVYASCGGTVSRAGWGKGYGYCVYIDHPDGRQTRYGHCSKVLVSVGDKVKQGDKIALSGNTGISTGAHLHFEILIGGTQVNPADYLQ